jgi:thioredoxin reductase
MNRMNQIKMKEAYFTQESIRRKSLEMLESVGEMRHRQPLIGEHCALLVLDVQKYFFSETSHAFIPSAAAIVGAGDAAFDYALNLGRNIDITILSRSEKSRCLPLLRADVHIQ